MKYVITGATSFIGAELVKYLLDRGNSVYAVCRRGSTAVEKMQSSAITVFADMHDYATLYERVPKADVFVNLAWGGTGHDGRNVADIQKENVDNTLQAIQSANRMGCKIFVEAGSQAEYGTIIDEITEDTQCNPFSEYGKAKLEVKKRAFELCEKLGMKYIHLRIFSVFGENDHPWTLVMSSIDKMLKGETVNLSPCTQSWNFIYVKDAVRQIVGLCEYAINSDDFKHEVYNVASDDTRELRFFVEELKQLTNSDSKLNFGAIQPSNIVSLRPNISKLISATHIVTFTPFADVVNFIIKKIKR